jgi:hypothetical protein
MFCSEPTTKPFNSLDAPQAHSHLEENMGENHALTILLRPLSIAKLRHAGDFYDRGVSLLRLATSKSLKILPERVQGVNARSKMAPTPLLKL